jgi:hypothetical protein
MKMGRLFLFGGCRPARDPHRGVCLAISNVKGADAALNAEPPIEPGFAQGFLSV